MKLTIEIGDYIEDGKLQSYTEAYLVPNEKGREPVYDKQGQTEEVARLIDLAEVIVKSVDNFYQSRNASLSSNLTNSSGEQGNT